MAEPKPYEGVTKYPVTAAPQEIVFSEEEGLVVTAPPTEEIVFSEGSVFFSPVVLSDQPASRGAEMAEPKPYEGVTGYPVTAAPAHEIVQAGGQPPDVQSAPPAAPADVGEAAYAMGFAYGLTGYPMTTQRLGAPPEVRREDPIVQEIIDVVSADAMFMKYADAPDYRAFGKWAGGIRDFKYWVSLKDAGKPEKAGGVEEYVCTGIASRAADLIKDAVSVGALHAVKGVYQIDRDFDPMKTHWMQHTATKVVLKDGREFVLDWHATLDARNPVVSTVGQFKGE